MELRELSIVQKTKIPNTRETIRYELAKLGVVQGMTLLVHSSLSSIGWVNGGAVAVVQALIDAVGPEGTLVMPTHSGDLSDLAGWEKPPVPTEWWDTIRATMPAYDPCFTRTRGMGAIPECFRTFSGTRRSMHPSLSFAAWGKQADYITDNHALDNSLGENSPLARIYELDGYVLLLGITHANDTSLHLSEYRADVRKTVIAGAPILRDGERVWSTYREIEYDSEPFEQLGDEFDKTGQTIIGNIGLATARLFHQRAAVDFGVEWLKKKIG